MKLIKLELHNFCQHEAREIDFSLGLSGILGHNGAGKSNLIQGLIYALTGTTANNLDSYIRRGSDGDSWVRLTFRSDLTDRTYVIKRGIKPRKAEFYCQSGDYTGKVIRKSKEIDAYLTDVLHIDFNIIKNVLTVSQEDFVSFFKTTPSVRAEILTRLFGFTELKTARESLRQLLIDTKVDNEYVPKLKAYRELLASEERSLVPYAELPDKSTVDSQYSEFEAKFNQVNDLVNLYKTLEFFDQQKVKLTNDLERLKDQREAIIQDQNAYLVDEDALKKLEVESVILEKKVASADRCYKTSVELLEKSNLYREAYTALQALPPAVSDEEYQSIMEQTAILRQKVEDLMQFESTGCCPTCGQPFPNLAKKLSKARDEYHEYKIKYKNLTLDLRAREQKETAFNYAWTQYRSKYVYIQELIEQSCNEDNCPLLKDYLAFLKTLPAIENPLDQWVDQLKVEVAKLTKLFMDKMNAWGDMKKKHEKYLEYQTKLESCRLSIRIASSNLQELKDRYPVIPEDSLSKEEAIKWLEKSGVTRTQYQQLLSDIQHATDIKNRIAGLKAQIAEIEELAKQDEARAELRENVVEACQALAPDAFPKYLMIGLLEMLTGNINYYLSAFNAPYSGKIDNSSTELYCEFNNGETFVASELSGGQKMILAISWRLALHNTFATEESCGFLTLDEPTNHLDADNIQNLTNVRAQVKQAAKGSNLQILVSTHEAALEPLFDSVIRL